MSDAYKGGEVSTSPEASLKPETPDPEMVLQPAPDAFDSITASAAYREITRFDR